MPSSLCLNFIGQRIRQFHQEKEAVVAEFYLGRGPSISGTSTKDYYSELYLDGTTCDITGAVCYNIFVNSFLCLCLHVVSSDMRCCVFICSNLLLFLRLRAY